MFNLYVVIHAGSFLNHAVHSDFTRSLNGIAAISMLRHLFRMKIIIIFLIDVKF